MRFPIRFFIVFIIFLSVSCSNSRESDKDKLIRAGLEQSADFSESFLNFYYENQIERSEAEYPEYFKATAERMRKIWYFYQEFDSFYSDTNIIRDSGQSKIYELYTKSLDSLNTIAHFVDTSFVALEFENEISVKIICKNHLENAKNILLRKLIFVLPKQIQSKKYYAFQKLRTEVNTSNEASEIFLSLEDLNAEFQHEILIDSIYPKANYSIDTSLIFGKIRLESKFKGVHSVYGKIKIEGNNGESYIPFFQSFELY